jgi:tape measure domain-containing protein
LSFQLASAYVQLSNRGFSGVMGGIASIGARLTALGPLALGAAAGIGAIGGAASLTGLIQLAANLEQTEARFKTLLGSADAAKKMVADLSQFAASTPFQMEGLSQTAQTLLAFGVTQDQVIPTMKALGDVAAASGADINELGNIYGKVRANGRLMTESLDQFNERAIPVGASLAKLFGKTESEIRKMASNGEISFADLQKAMVQMTSEGGMAFGGMEAQSKTLGGLFSTLSDNITLTLTDIGVALVEGFDLSSVTTNLTTFTDRIRGEWMPSIVAGFRWMSDNVTKPVIWAVGYMADIFMDFFGNFDLYWQIGSLTAQNFASNVTERIRVMSVNMVEMVVWAVNNWRNLLVDLGNANLTVFQNIGENLRAMWQGVLDFIAGRGFNVDFTPLLEGFESSIKQMPQLTQGEFDKIKPQIDQVYAQLKQRQDEAAQRDTATSAAPTSLAIEEGGGTAGDKGGGKDKASFVGLSQLAERMQAQAGEKQDAQRQIAAAEAAAKANEQLLAKANGEGLRVSMATVAGPPTVPFEFGAT